VQGRGQDVEDYLVRVAGLLERYGVTLQSPGGDHRLRLLEDDSGNLSFELVGDLPGDTSSTWTQVVVREQFLLHSVDRYARALYEYEIVDHQRDYRRAFHLHSPDWFERRFLVLVHEHCERPIGSVRCEHYEGSPIRDAYAGVTALMDTWTGPAPDCSRLRCLG
jgi:hypothetical protein